MDLSALLRRLWPETRNDAPAIRLGRRLQFEELEAKIQPSATILQPPVQLLATPALTANTVPGNVPGTMTQPQTAAVAPPVLAADEAGGDVTDTGDTGSDTGDCGCDTGDSGVDTSTTTTPDTSTTTPDTSTPVSVTPDPNLTNPVNNPPPTPNPNPTIADTGSGDTSASNYDGAGPTGPVTKPPQGPTGPVSRFNGEYTITQTGTLTNTVAGHASTQPFQSQFTFVVRDGIVSVGAQTVGAVDGTGRIVTDFVTHPAGSTVSDAFDGTIVSGAVNTASGTWTLAGYSATTATLGSGKWVATTTPTPAPTAGSSVSRFDGVYLIAENGTLATPAGGHAQPFHSQFAFVVHGGDVLIGSQKVGSVDAAGHIAADFVTHPAGATVSNAWFGTVGPGATSHGLWALTEHLGATTLTGSGTWGATI